MLKLPPGVSGELRWNGKVIALRQGKQEMQLPAASVRH
jgi:hypothetical protein